jgi:hypothetical protein
MVNSGVRGTKNNHFMIEVDCTFYLSYHNLVPITGTGNLYYWCCWGILPQGIVPVMAACNGRPLLVTAARFS